MSDYLLLFLPVFGLGVNLLIQIASFRFWPQIGLLKTVYAGFASGLIAVVLGNFYGGPSLFVMNFLIYSALAYCYFYFIILGETARRIRIIREIHDSENGLSMESLLKKYDATLVAIQCRPQPTK